MDTDSDQQQLISRKLHLEKFKNRVQALQEDLTRAQSEAERLEKLLQYWQERKESQDGEFKNRVQDLETKYRREIDAYRRQIELSQEMLAKKEDDRCALLGILNQLNFCDKLDKNLKGVDWESLKKIAMKNKNTAKLVAQTEKAKELACLLQKAKVNVAELAHIRSVFNNLRSQFRAKLEAFKNSIQERESMNAEHEKQLSKMQIDSERLRLLIKQCAMSNEPMSDFVTKNVRAKCHSFLDSDRTEDLLKGLIKFKERQTKMITLLKHKENRLIRDCNLLKVAADQTMDHTQYYIDLAQSSTKNSALNLNLSIPDFHEQLIQK